ncbi:plasmodesmata callose-binding protein 3 [Dichanthelium oligosanthes]|uniref:Plasmodesmata callose-binding protein 3 n=1 Tax=Dichanthelium oligosanthes TaxID=888268 RepID=A0A1E5WDX2_9POAL|nr:plasmodesmata callose-binding protein 3 [Dichanthelium oligosanthes]
MKALVVAVVLLLSSTLAASQWCVCRQDAPQAALQKTIDYACGAGADCNSIHETGPCYNPNNVPAHCSWAANSYYQNNKAKGATCDFTGTATLTTSDPSSSGCSYPTGASAAGTMTPTTGGTMGGTPGTPGTSTGGTMGGTPGTFTPGAGTTGTGMGTGTTTGTTGTGLGLGPTGTGAGMDTAAAGLLPRAGLATILTVLLFAIAFA